MLCNNLEGWDGVRGEREVQEEGDIGILRLIHVDVWQKLTPYCHYLPMKSKFFIKERNRKRVNVCMCGCGYDRRVLRVCFQSEF